MQPPDDGVIVNETQDDRVCDLCGAEDDVIEEPCEEPGFSMFLCSGCRTEIAPRAELFARTAIGCGHVARSTISASRQDGRAPLSDNGFR
jgi:hypothetical protein